MIRNTKSVLVVLSSLICSAASAQPAVRTFAGGLAFFRCDQGSVQEPVSIRIPGTVPCPFHVVGPHGNVVVREIQLPGPGPVPCFWFISADVTPGRPTVFVGTPTGMACSIARAFDHASGLTATRLDFSVNSCDYDVDGSVTVMDFMSFLNDWAATGGFDWTGDGFLNNLDIGSFLGLCGS